MEPILKPPIWVVFDRKDEKPQCILHMDIIPRAGEFLHIGDQLNQIVYRVHSVEYFVLNKEANGLYLIKFIVDII